MRTCRRNFIEILFVMAIMVGIVFRFDIQAYAKEAKPNILILNSYHKGLAWTDDETEGILGSLKKEGLNSCVYIEYMDWKRHPEMDNLQGLYNYFRYKYDKVKIDTVVATDDAALKFALENRKELFSDAPVVFCGVNEGGLSAVGKGYSNFTGVIEQVDPGSAVKTALEIEPGIKNFYIVYDQTESGVSTGILAMESIKSLKKGMNAVPMTGKSHEAILAEAQQLQKGNAILLTTYFTDIKGEFVEYEEFCSKLSKVSSVPVFSLYDFALGYGTVGGTMLSGKLQGENAGLLAARILKGEKADAIPVVRVDTMRNAFDYERLKRFGIPLNRITPGSEIINKPFSLFETHRTLIILVTIIIILLIGINFATLAYNRKILRLKKELQENHEELTQVYEELAASDEELKQQFDEMSGMQENLQKSEEMHRLLIEATNDAIMEWDLKSGKMHFSGRWHYMAGYNPDELNGIGTLRQLIHPEDYNAVEKVIEEHYKRRSLYFTCQYRIKTKDGKYKWFFLRGTTIFDGEGLPYRMVGASIDIDELKCTQDKLRELAYHDHLTGIPNRLSLQERLKKCMLEDKENKFAVIFIDTDNLKLINNTIGHHFGDLFLISVGKRLKAVVEPCAEVYSVDGDEFVILLFLQQGIERIKALAEEIIKAFKEPLDVGGSNIHTTLSLGISIYPDDGDTIEEILMNADIAMREAKSQGKAKYIFYERTMYQAAMERMELEKYLRSAIENNEFIVYYQPQYDLKTRKICGFEALLRWNSPVLGFVSPLKFIKIAEDSHLIIPLGRWVLEKACEFIKSVHAKGYLECTVSVNVSVVQLLQDDFVDMVVQVIDTYNLPASFLELEITESVLMESFEIVNEKLKGLMDMGIKIALDDFGQGYSSLGYLRQLPITTLKIDKAFIDDISAMRNNRAITGSVVLLGHKLGLETVAEGVETEEQLFYLTRHKCNKVQGYLFSKPVPEEEALKLLYRE